MENRRIIKFILVFSVIFLFAPVFSFAYNDTYTHPAITDEIIDLFNHYYPNSKISDNEKALIKKGSTDEDIPPRWMQHFYDPVYNRGLVLIDEWEKSKDWAQDTIAQAGVSQNSLASLAINYFSYPDDYSWDRAVYEYVWGNKNRALEALGHTLHLLEDATVPDHTRNDIHLSLPDQGSPYEDWTKQFNDKNFTLSRKLIQENKKPIIYSDLNQYFDNNAIYSNNNFFSKDTTPDKQNRYFEPIITKDKEKNEILSDGLLHIFGYTKIDNKNTRLVEIEPEFNFITGTFENKYNVNDIDHLIMVDYWSLLSERAVLNGAGVVKLFFDAVEKEKNSKVLLGKNTSFLGKIVAAIGNIFNPPTPGAGEEQPAETPTEHIPDNHDRGQVESDQVLPPILAPLPLQPLQPSQSPQSTTVVDSVLPYAGFGGGGAPPPALSSTPALSDTTPPTYPLIISPADFSQTFTSTQITFTGTAEALSTISSDFNSGTTTANPADNWSLQISFPQGTTTIKFYATDSAGNISGSTKIDLTIDSLAPDISFNVSECVNSLSSDGCLLATATINAFWYSSANDIDYFEFNNNNIATTTTATSTTISVLDSSTNTFSVRAKDAAGNWSAPATKSVEISLTPVVINEIAWMGTVGHDEDEWIELYNRTSKIINLNNWILYSQTDQKPWINLSGQIPANGYYLIERTNDSTVNDIAADWIGAFGSGTGMGLVNSGEVLILSYASTTIDQTPNGSWTGGNNTNKTTMERYEPDISGTDPNNWSTNNRIIKNGKGVDNQDVNGTPKTRNSVNYLIAKGSSWISSDVVLTKAKSPYLVVDNQLQTFQASSTLTIEPGVIIKFSGSSGISFVQNAKILAQGTAAEHITFTRFSDAGYWYGIEIQTTNSDSIFDYVDFKYGGSGVGNHDADLNIKNTSAKITNSVFENSKIHGLKLVNSNSLVSGNTFKDNNSEVNSAGLYSESGAPIIQTNIFSGNRRGFYLVNSLATTEENIFNSNTDKAIYSAGPTGNFSNNSGTGNGTNAIVIFGGDITRLNSTTTLRANSLAYVLENSGSVVAGSGLVIEPGVTIKSTPFSTKLNVFGGLLINGINSGDIIFTANADNLAKGYWKGINFYLGSYSSIRGATFKYADTAITYNDSPINLSNIKFYENNLAISASSASLVQTVEAATIEFLNNIATTSPHLW